MYIMSIRQNFKGVDTRFVTFHSLFAFCVKFSLLCFQLPYLNVEHVMLPYHSLVNNIEHIIR